IQTLISQIQHINKIIGLPTPSNNSDAATKKYVDDSVTASGSNNADVSTLKSYFTNEMLNLANFNKPSTANYVLTDDGTNPVWKLLTGSNITVRINFNQLLCKCFYRSI